jgi:type IV pilus assembly protein PilM
MANVQGVWGIDIGQCAIKALRCLPGDEEGTVTADAFDIIEYPKILSQPEANPAELIADALTQFLSRNSLRGDKVAISVPGQNGLSRFIKLPPVETKKIPDIVRYEAKQQIPFDLNDVIWDFQTMVGGTVAEGYALDTEVGLFAMKREQVAKALRPLADAGIEVDVVQLAPLCLCNFIAFDQLTDLPDVDQFDPENPPESVLVMSLGTDTTDLVITNGFRVWQRNVPIGGSHFTKVLAKELKQTFAKAEHIKRNAAQAENPKALFQAMRPVFNDLMTEVQRSINFFSNIDKKAKIKGGLALGNTAKLPGLVRFLSQNLKLPIERVESFRSLRGSAVVGAPAFRENALSFAAAYGLCLQVLENTRSETNLILPEIVKERLIKAKKPWAAGAAAALLLGLSIVFAAGYHEYSAVRPERFEKAESQANSFLSQYGGYKTQYDAAKTKFTSADNVGKHLVYNLEKRRRWLRLLQAIQASLPAAPPGSTEPPLPGQPVKLDPRLYVTEITSREVGNLTDWYVQATTETQSSVVPGGGRQAPGAPGVPPGDGGQGAATPSTTPAPADAPKGKGWVITIKGYHYHNDPKNPNDQGNFYVRSTLIQNLKQPEMTTGDPNDATVVDVGKIGISHPVTVRPGRVDWEYKVPNPEYDEAHPERADPFLSKPRYDFEVQFCWREPEPGPATGAPAGANQVAATTTGGVQK